MILSRGTICGHQNSYWAGASNTRAAFLSEIKEAENTGAKGD
jgi:hypothetical protein